MGWGIRNGKNLNSFAGILDLPYISYPSLILPISSSCKNSSCQSRFDRGDEGWPWSEEPNEREVRDFSKYDVVCDLDAGPDSLSL